MSLSDNSGDFSVFYDQIRHLALLHVQTRRLLYGLFHFEMIAVLVGLSPERMNCRSLGGIEHLALNKCLIYVDAHLSSESIYLSDQMAFSRTSD